MSVIRKSLLQMLFSGFFMRRWNDKLRPKELYEIDKQAHKMLVAFMLAQINSRSLPASDRFKLQQKIVERGLFDYLYRLITTDIKPPVFYKIKENPKHYDELTQWVINSLQPVVEPLDPTPGGLWERLVTYHRRRDRSELADRILDAAHLYASGWEFRVIKPFNTFDEESHHIDESFTARLDAIADVQGLAEVRAGSSTALGRFALLCGQLRFQTRWSDTPRIPETSVLGHMYLVAVLVYCCSIATGACRARCVNNFFAGLVHDLPELLTRDIITPVKHSVRELPRLIREYELAQMEELIFAPLAAGHHEDIVARLRYFLGLEGDGIESEFDETVRRPDGLVVRMPDFDTLHCDGNVDELDPKDGSLLKACDCLAAYLEAHTSIRRGITSPDLQQAVVRLGNELRGMRFDNLVLGTVIADFD